MDTHDGSRIRWLAVFPPLAIFLLMLGGAATPEGLDHPITGMGTALTELNIAALHPGQVYVSNALILLGLGALGVSFVAIAMLAGGFDSTLAVTAAAIGGIGCFCGIVVNVTAGLALAGAATSSVARDTAARVLVSTNTATVSSVVLVVYLGGTVLGGILLGIALWRSGNVPRWLAAAFPVGLILGSAAPPGILNVVLSLPIAVVMVLLAMRIWRTEAPTTESSHPRASMPVRASTP